MTTAKIDTNVFERHIGHRLPTIVRGEGPYLWDGDGKKYLDAVCGTCVVNIGHGVDEVLALFRTSPDFNERVARYQVEHLAGLRGSRVKYLPYKCANMRSLGLCADPEGRVCGRVSHPLQYYIRRARGARRGEGAA